MSKRDEQTDYDDRLADGFDLLSDIDPVDPPPIAVTVEDEDWERAWHKPSTAKQRQADRGKK